MFDSVNRAVLSLASPETLKSLGLWLIIGGLVAEAAVIVFVPSGKTEKTLSVIFTLVIAAGVWIEHVGASALEAAHEAQARLELAKLQGPRNLSPAAQGQILARLKTFGAKPFNIGVLIGGLEPGSELADQLIAILSAASWQLQPWIADPGQRGAPAPNSGVIGIVGIVGVKIFFADVKSDEFAEAAKALSEELNREGIAAVATPLPSIAPNAIHISIGAKT
jgi:hypothetical protein